MKATYYGQVYKVEFKKENEHGKFYFLHFPAGAVITVHERNLEF